MSIRGALHSTLDSLRDRFAPVTYTSTFLTTGQITPEEFVTAGDYLVYKFPTWAWSGASSANKRVNYLPDAKQYLVTHGVPCARRLGPGFAGNASEHEQLVHDELGPRIKLEGIRLEDDDVDQGWLNTSSQGFSGSGQLPEMFLRTTRQEQSLARPSSMDIPDMDDEDMDDSAVARIESQIEGEDLRTYTLCITYTPYYRTPRLYLSGGRVLSGGHGTEPLSPESMMEDVVGDYAEKTVTLEDFPFYDSTLRMMSVHPCKHAHVMKILLDRANHAAQLQAARTNKYASPTEVRKHDTNISKMYPDRSGAGPDDEASKDDWDLVEQQGMRAGEAAIRVDQYLVVFLKVCDL